MKTSFCNIRERKGLGSFRRLTFQLRWVSDSAETPRRLRLGGLGDRSAVCSSASSAHGRNASVSDHARRNVHPVSFTFTDAEADAGRGSARARSQGEKVAADTGTRAWTLGLQRSARAPLPARTRWPWDIVWPPPGSPSLPFTLCSFFFTYSISGSWKIRWLFLLRVIVFVKEAFREPKI